MKLKWILRILSHPPSTTSISNPLPRYPGPRLTAISRLPLIWLAIKGETWQFTGKVHALYGSIVGTALDEMSATFSGAWKVIHTSKPFIPKGSLQPDTTHERRWIHLYSCKRERIIEFEIFLSTPSLTAH